MSIQKKKNTNLRKSNRSKYAARIGARIVSDSADIFVTPTPFIVRYFRFSVRNRNSRCETPGRANTFRTLCTFDESTNAYCKRLTTTRTHNTTRVYIPVRYSRVLTGFRIIFEPRTRLVKCKCASAIHISRIFERALFIPTLLHETTPRHDTDHKNSEIDNHQ